MRWFITKNHLVWLIGILVAALIYSLLAGCIPVTVRPEFDAAGLPIALPVTPVGSVSMDGTLTPIYPVSTTAPTAFDWGTIGTVIGGITTALLAVYGINLRGAFVKAKTAIAIVSDLADRNAEADTIEQVEHNKSVAKSMQINAGVRALTQVARGKKQETEG